MPETCCTCDDCRNFADSFPAPFPPEALALFQRLGIEARYPSEVVHYNRIQPERHYYGGWFHVIGELLEGEAQVDAHYNRIDEHGNRVRDFAPLGTGFELRFSTRWQPMPEVFAGRPTVALEFFTAAPWVLDERESD